MVVSVAGAMHDSSETNDTSADDVASVALRDVEFCVLDLETTGGSSEFEAITEIGAVKYRGGEEIGRFATRIYCDFRSQEYIRRTLVFIGFQKLISRKSQIL